MRSVDWNLEANWLGSCWNIYFVLTKAKFFFSEAQYSHLVVIIWGLLQIRSVYLEIGKQTQFVFSTARSNPPPLTNL
jgi:hypothetical protein